MSIDHIYPVYLGGPNRQENLRPAHRDCNNQRQSQPSRQINYIYGFTNRFYRYALGSAEGLDRALVKRRTVLYPYSREKPDRADQEAFLYPIGETYEDRDPIATTWEVYG
jgi:hypothetical protein